MIKGFIFSFFLLVLSNSLQAQKYSIGPVLSTSAKGVSPITIYGDNLLFSHQKKAYGYSKYGLYSLSKSAVIKDQIDILANSKSSVNGDLVYASTNILTKDGIMVLGYHYNSRQNTKDFYVRKFNQNLELDFDWKMINQMDGKSIKSVYPDFSISSDSTEVFFVFEYPGSKKEDFQKIKIVSVTQSGAVSINQDVTLPYPQKYLTINKICKFDNGKIGLITFFKETRKNKVNIDNDEDTNDEILTFLIDLKTGSSKEFRINDGSYTGSGYSFSQDKNQLIYTALLSEKVRKYNTLSGVGILKLDAEKNTISELKPQLFDNKTIQNIIEASKNKLNKEIKGKDVLINYYRIYSTKTDPSDGSTIVTAQLHYMYQRCVTDSRGNQRCNTYYYYGDIIVIKLSKNDELIWVNVLPRSHVYPFEIPNGDIGFSFFKKDQYCVFFTDGTNNDNNKKVTKKSRSAVVYCFDKNGTMKKEVISNVQKDDIYLSDWSGVKISENELVLSGYWKRKWKFVKIKF